MRRFKLAAAMLSFMFFAAPIAADESREGMRSAVEAAVPLIMSEFASLGFTTDDARAAAIVARRLIGEKVPGDHEQLVEAIVTVAVNELGRIEFRSRPAGAKVTIADREIGTTPVAAWLPAGTSAVTFHGEQNSVLKRCTVVAQAYVLCSAAVARWSGDGR